MRTQTLLVCFEGQKGKKCKNKSSKNCKSHSILDLHVIEIL